jgi:hypothetical protein
MEWTDDYNRIVCELFAEQVRRENRPNTHLNTLGYIEVSGRFYQMTEIELSKTQIKNKWDRLKNDLVHLAKVSAESNRYYHFFPLL